MDNLRIIAIIVFLVLLGIAFLVAFGLISESELAGTFAQLFE